MTEARMREAARQFFYKWKNKGNEDEDARSYWIDLLANVFGAENVTDRLQFEKKVIGSDGNTKRIDVYIPETRVLIEQKSLGIPLDKPQSGHGGKTPYEQAKYYDNYLPFGEKARWILTSNFAEIWIYDMEERKPEATVIKLGLADLQTKFHALDFLLDKETRKITQETEISLKAGEIVGELYDALRAQYKNPDSPDTLQSLNKLCVRLVFCLYSEDADVFGRKNIFHDYLAQFRPHQIRKALRDLFRVLNQRQEERDPYLADDDPILASFPYVNGNLFDADDIEIPPFSEEIQDLLLRKASEEFDWSGINGTIFGAVFESTLNPETRRSGGMHYTSIENIHKLIDPLFLDDLKEEFRQIRQMDVWKQQKPRLEAFQEKLARLRFLDPAAGSGNFLTETFTSLRRLENEVIALLTRGQMSFGEAKNPVKVSIGQFAGIEINDFAVTVARTALWIAENQMLRETEDIVRMNIDFLPLKTTARIVEGNALRMDWGEVAKKDELNYIIGNPPFVGYSLQSKEQKADILSIFVDEKGKPYKTAGKIDYVSGWFWKASELMKETDIRTAFVSTNSITQGEQVASIWQPLFERFGIHIDYAYRTFRWDSEASIKAHVHCVILGFSCGQNPKKRLLFVDSSVEEADTINPYLVAAETVFIESRKKPLSPVPQMLSGNRPTDGGYLILSAEEKEALLRKEPAAAKWVKQFMMGYEFINRVPRYCLWLVGITPNELRKLPLVMERVEK